MWLRSFSSGISTTFWATMKECLLNVRFKTHMLSLYALPFLNEVIESFLYFNKTQYTQMHFGSWYLLILFHQYIRKQVIVIKGQPRPINSGTLAASPNFLFYWQN